MSRFEDTTTMRMPPEAAPIELLRSEIGPLSEARGIVLGALLGAIGWIAIVALALAMWRWLG